MMMKKFILTAMAIVAIATVTANAGIIHQWDFDADATDSVGSADGALGGNAAITTGAGGKFGEAVSLDGTDGTCVDIGGSLIPTTAFTLTAWVNQASQAEGERMTVAGSQSGGAQGAFIRIDSGTPFGRTLPMDSSYNTLISNGSVPVGEWTHLALTYANDGNLTMYVNGISVGSVAAQPNFTDSSNFKIGCQSGDSALFNFDGLIDDVRIYDEALSADGVAASMVPEPATLALLGLGGLVLRRRRNG